MLSWRSRLALVSFQFLKQKAFEIIRLALIIMEFVIAILIKNSTLTKWKITMQEKNQSLSRTETDAVCVSVSVMCLTECVPY